MFAISAVAALALAQRIRCCLQYLAFNPKSVVRIGKGLGAVWALDIWRPSIVSISAVSGCQSRVCGNHKGAGVTGASPDNSAILRFVSVSFAG